MTDCPECGFEILEPANACPECGCPWLANPPSSTAPLSYPAAGVAPPRNPYLLLVAVLVGVVAVAGTSIAVVLYSNNRAVEAVKQIEASRQMQAQQEQAQKIELEKERLKLEQEKLKLEAKKVEVAGKKQQLANSQVSRAESIPGQAAIELESHQLGGNNNISSPAHQGDDFYTIQVASRQSYDEALAISRQIPDSSVRSRLIDGVTWHAVIVGRFAAKSGAVDFKSQVISNYGHVGGAEDIPKAFVTNTAKFR